MPRKVTNKILSPDINISPRCINMKVHLGEVFLRICS